MFSLKDFMEKTKAREMEEEKAEEDVEMDGEEEVLEKKAADSSEDESVIDDDESMMMQGEEDDDSDLEVIVKSDQEMKKSSNELEDSDIESEITKLHDIIGELSKPDLEKSLKEEEVKIVDEKTETILPTKSAFESQPTKEPILVEEDGEMSKTEKAGLGKFSGLSIKKNLKDEESESEKKPDDGYEWQNMEKEEKTGKNDDEEVKIEGAPVFSEMRNATPTFWSAAPNPSPTIAGLPPGLKVEIKEVQGRRCAFFLFFIVACWSFVRRSVCLSAYDVNIFSQVCNEEKSGRESFKADPGFKESDNQS